MRLYFYIVSAVLIIGTAILGYFFNGFLWLYLIWLPLFALGMANVLQTKHSILRNFPVLGHIRYFCELIRPEIRQYLIESDLDGRPLSRDRRSIVYQRAKGDLCSMPYGTRRDVYEAGYEWINHSVNAKRALEEEPRVKVGGKDCKQKYSASILNISAMSFGSLSREAILALNHGAKIGGFYHNTGEGGISPYHLEHGGDLVFQVGTGYFGCRTVDGVFSPKNFREKATLPSVKMIEIKLSQGAKPGHGGILPRAKLTEEIATIRGVPMGYDVLSPPAHTAFTTPIELMQFIKRLRELSGGKPVGFKLCVGHRHEFFAICKAMLETKILPDFITVDGGEGGTGAAPMEFSNAVGRPLNDGLSFVHSALVGANLRKDITVICSGKLMTGFEVVSKLALGADMCNLARAMMLAVGCIQSLQCNSNTCPTGVTTQDPWLRKGLVPEQKYKRVANLHHSMIDSVLEITAAVGLDNPSELRAYHVFRRINATNIKRLDEIYHNIEPGQLLVGDLPHFYQKDWAMASAHSFDAQPIA